jgi:Fe(3+) dicitrate transport protein
LGTDFLAAGGAGTGDLFNGGSARTQGLEVEAVVDALPGVAASLPIRLAYTYTDARFTTGFASEFEAWGDVVAGDALPYLAPHQLAVVASYERSAFAADVSARYTAAMRTVAGQGDLLPQFSTDAATVVDAGVRWFASEALTFSAGMNNLFDATYVVARRPAGLRPGMPRSFRLGLQLDF